MASRPNPPARARTPVQDIGRALAQAAGLLRAGYIAPAEQLCRQILAIRADEPGALHLLGVCLLQQGRFEAAEQSLSACLKAAPGDPAALGNLGIALQAMGRREEALDCYARSLARAPMQAATWNMQGLALLDLRRHDEALASFDRAVAIAPQLAEAWCNRANALVTLRRHDEALESLERALALRPGYGEALSNRALVLNLLGRHAEALAAAQQALALLPASALVLRVAADALAGLRRFDEALPLYERAIEAGAGDGPTFAGRAFVLLSLGRAEAALADIDRALALLGESVRLRIDRARALRAAGRRQEVQPELDRALALDPRSADALGQLADALFEFERWDDAQTCFRRLAELDPHDAHAHNSLGLLASRAGRPGEAERCYRQALRIRPDFFAACNNLGLLLKDTHRFAEAEQFFRTAIALNPRLSAPHSNLAMILRTLGRLDEAESSLRRAVEAAPEQADARGHLLLHHCYCARGTPAEALREAREYGAHVAARVAQRYASWPALVPPRRLRVGLVSGDLREHPVGYFLDGLLEQLDPARVELYAYPTQPSADGLTQRLRARCAAWRPLVGLDDPAAAALIYGDGVHVLIDLAGHTAFNRLPVFAYKPAPVQVSWLGYFATTGVAEIDFVLADPVSVPAAQRGHFSETVWYLPETRLCFTPPQDAPEVAPLPALGRGFVTFGCFQNLAKVNDAVLATWARLLDRLPAARLRLQVEQLADAAVRQSLGERLTRAGIGAQRVDLHPVAPRREYLAAYDDVDLLLDTFPFPGGTTTCEALYMGVPTLTLAGDRMIGLQGASLLTAAGLPDWIAHSTEDYLARALAAAGDLPALAALRARLRAQVLASPVFDTRRFARHLETALWEMWRARGSAATAAAG